MTVYSDRAVLPAFRGPAEEDRLAAERLLAMGTAGRFWRARKIHNGRWTWEYQHPVLNAPRRHLIRRGIVLP